MTDERASGYIARHDPDAMEEAILRDRRKAAEVRFGEIKTDCICPPIPLRQFDYCAWFDGRPEFKQGFGRTEEKAITDLLEQVEELEEDNESTVYLSGDDDGSGLEPHRR